MKLNVDFQRKLYKDILEYLIEENEEDCLCDPLIEYTDEVLIEYVFNVINDFVKLKYSENSRYLSTVLDNEEKNLHSKIIVDLFRKYYN